MLRPFGSWLLRLLALLLLTGALFSQIQTGNIVGLIRVSRGDFPAHQVLVELRFRGGTLNSTYADAQGHFSFDGLLGNEYHVVINDDDYSPVDERADVDPHSSIITMVQITLVPREDSKNDDPVSTRASGGNPYLVNPTDYNKHFPKKALKEYERGLDAQYKGKLEEAIEHYQGALKIAPDYYPAHNNLGALYLGKSDFKAAEAEFRESVRLDQNEAQAYFNLGNVLMLTGRYSESKAVVEAGLQRRPDSAFALFLQGCLLERTGKF